MRRILFVFCFLVFAFPAAAVEPGEILSDPVLESRARDISRQLRCLVCQGEDIDESNAYLLWLTPLAVLAGGLGFAWLYMRRSAAKGG